MHPEIQRLIEVAKDDTITTGQLAVIIALILGAMSEEQRTKFQAMVNLIAKEGGLDLPFTEGF